MSEKQKKKEPRRFCNVALLPEDHKKLAVIAERDHRAMTRQLSVIIRKEFESVTKSVKK